MCLGKDAMTTPKEVCLFRECLLWVASEGMEIAVDELPAPRPVVMFCVGWVYREGAGD